VAVKSIKARRVNIVWIIIFILTLLVIYVFDRYGLIKKSNALSWMLTIIVIIAIVLIGGNDAKEGIKVVAGWIK
jgi:cell division protein FtsW (lipid II flippase)